MSALAEPSRRRLRDARAAGLRPRSPALAVGFAALVAWALVDGLVTRAPAWLGLALERGFRGDPLGASALRPLVSSAMFVAVFGGCAVLLIALFRSRASPRSLGVSARLGEIPGLVALVTCVAALALLAAGLRPVVAAAARGVDVAGVSSLWSLWVGWLERGLLTLAAISVGLGVIEHLVSARLLWQGLHLTRAQAREQARASGERRR